MMITKLQDWFYQKYVRPHFFSQDPEKSHDQTIQLGKFLTKQDLGRILLKDLMHFSDKSLEQKIEGIEFKNPVGLAAGFDKNAELTDLLPHIGFGFAEVGSITGEFCEGNEKPRLWRHKADKSLRVYYGLKNDGSKLISERLAEKHFEIPFGISIAKTNSKETVEEARGIEDYVKAYTAFANIGAYDTINISCPNAFGGQPFTNKESLNKLLAALKNVENSKPMFLKLSPDLNHEELDALLEVAKEHGVKGIICTNLSKKHDHGNGGMSGKVLAKASIEQLKYLYPKYKNDFVFISVGGISSAEDAYERIRYGASLVQLITGLIYEGPQLVGKMNKGLVELMKKDGYTSISEVIGSGYGNS